MAEAGEALCKGAWLLGTACGKCSRCITSAREVISALDQQAKRDATRFAKASGALSLAPEPSTKPDAEWMLRYAMWFYRTRADAQRNDNGT